MMEITYADKELIKKYKVKPLEKTITRKISYKLPAGAKFNWPDKIQTVVYHRIGYINPNDRLHDGYGVWSAIDKAIWPEVVSPRCEGYKTNLVTVPRVMLTADSHDESIDVTYTPVSEETKEATKKAEEQKQLANESNKLEQTAISDRKKLSKLQNNLFADLTTPNDSNSKVSEDLNLKKQDNLLNISDNQLKHSKGKSLSKDSTSYAESNDKAEKNTFGSIEAGYGPSKEKKDEVAKKSFKKEIKDVDNQADNKDSSLDNEAGKVEDVSKSNNVLEKDETNQNQYIRSDYERNFAHLADMHRRPIILSNEYAYLRDNSVVASVISELAQTGEIDYVPVRHKWHRIDYDWSGLFE